MQKVILYISLAFMATCTKVAAQEVVEQKSFEQRAKEISLNIKTIAKEEKEALKKEIEGIDKAVENGSMTKEEAEKTKTKIAEERANNIETKIAAEEAKLRELVNENIEIKPDSSSNYSIAINTPLAIKNNKKDLSKGEKRTTSQFVFATGFNNLVTDGAVANSNFGYLRSTFYEWGFTWNTRLTKNTNLLHLKYGLGFQYNMLHATDNRVFADTGDQTVLVTSPIELKQRGTYFKNVYLVAPVHFEFDFSKTNTKEDGTKAFKSHQGVRIGLGGFVGVNTNSKQFISYEIDNKKVHEKTKSDFNVNDMTYGLSTYIGYKETSLYLKYDLNPLFKNNTIDQNNISLGIRFDFN